MLDSAFYLKRSSLVALWNSGKLGGISIQPRPSHCLPPNSLKSCVIHLYTFSEVSFHFGINLGLENISCLQLHASNNTFKRHYQVQKVYSATAILSFLIVKQLGLRHLQESKDLFELFVLSFEDLDRGLGYQVYYVILSHFLSISELI